MKRLRTWIREIGRSVGCALAAMWESGTPSRLRCVCACAVVAGVLAVVRSVASAKAENPVAVNPARMVAALRPPTPGLLEVAPGYTTGPWGEAWIGGDPQAMTFDARGRLYVVERGSESQASGGDHIRILEDPERLGVVASGHLAADSPGRAVFAGVSSLLATADQLWVAQETRIVTIQLTAPSQPGEPATAILEGLGVRIGSAGHGIHGLAIGSDGYLYFSLGDQGTRLRTRDGVEVDLPDTGAVLRCRSDGANLEVVATGLRCPGDLAFDEAGNLFTTDGDAGFGDRSRLVHVVEGGDSGWRTGFQHAPRGWGGAWMSEGLWKLRFAGQPAYLLPPVALLPAAPTALAADPGDGLTTESERGLYVAYRLRTVDDSLVQMLRLKAAGAGFGLERESPVMRGLMPTALAFGPEGRLHVADAVTSWPWPASGRGRIHVLGRAHETASERAESELTRQRLARDPGAQPSDELVAWLSASDRRVRLAGQFELVRRGGTSVAGLEAVATRSGAPRVARLHAVWGLGQLAERVPAALNQMPPLLRDSDGEVRAQVAKVLGDAFRIEAFQALRAALRDADPRVVFFAAQSLGKLRRNDAVPVLIDALRKNDDQDVLIRHAIVVALARLGPHPALAAMAEDPSRAVRLGGLLAARRSRDPALTVYLEDADPVVVTEAAHAVHDLPVVSGLPALAAMLETVPLDDEALVLRALNAQAQAGSPENARALAEFAAKPTVPSEFRVEALHHLASWGQSPMRDRITGLPRSSETRDPAPARQAFGDFLSRMSAKTPEPVQIATLRAVAALRVPGTGHALWDVVYQEARPVATRVAALQALESMDDLRLEVAAQHAARSTRVELRLAAISVLSRRHPGVSLPLLEPLARKGTVAEQRRVYAVLATLPDERATGLLLQALHRLEAGEVPAAAEVELLAAVEARGGTELTAAARDLERRRRLDMNPLARHRSALDGGDPEAGRDLFERHATLACIRCHTTTVSCPDPGRRENSLVKFGARRSTTQVLEALDRAGTPGACLQTGTVDGLSRSELRDLVAYVSDLGENPRVRDEFRACR
ncbi:MAG: HEAT repeat domain-containing protein [Opitutaceae bacterium]|nr:HEAT repeat domain-containing protein [Opitutaceae bacterium]